MLFCYVIKEKKRLDKRKKNPTKANTMSFTLKTNIQRKKRMGWDDKYRMSK